MTNTATRVNRGARFLDRIMPGWASLIDVAELDFWDGCDVLGQLYCRPAPAPEGYLIAQDAARNHGVKDVVYMSDRLGFSLPDEEGWGEANSESDWNELTELWRQEVAARV